MKAKKYWIVLAILAICGTALALTNLLTDEEAAEAGLEVTKFYHRETLAGLDGIGVIVSELPPEAEKYGLRSEALQTDTELRLRQNGIKVLSAVETAYAQGTPYLHIYLNLNIIEEIKRAAITIAVRFNQEVFLKRDATIPCFIATTWEREAVMQVGVYKLKEARDLVKDFVDEFCNDYFAVNPKEQPTKGEVKNRDIFDQVEESTKP